MADAIDELKFYNDDSDSGVTTTDAFSAWKERTKVQPKPYQEETGFVTDLGRSLGRGTAAAGELFGNTLEQIGISNPIDEYFANRQKTYYMPDESEYKDEESWVKKTITGALEFAPTTIGLVALSTAGAALAPIAGVTAGIGAAAGTGAGMLGVMAGTARQTEEQLKKTAPWLTNEERKTYARNIGISEGVSEGVSAVIPFGLGKAIAKFGGKGLVKGVGSLVSNLSGKQIISTVLGGAAADTAGEVANTLYQVNQTNKANDMSPGDAGYIDPESAVKDMLGPSMLLGSVFGAWSVGQTNTQRRAMRNILENPGVTDKDTRLKVVQQIATEVGSKSDPAAGAKFLEAGEYAVANDLPMPVDEEFSDFYARSDQFKKDNMSRTEARRLNPLTAPVEDLANEIDQKLSGNLDSGEGTSSLVREGMKSTKDSILPVSPNNVVPTAKEYYKKQEELYNNLSNNDKTLWLEASKLPNADEKIAKENILANDRINKTQDALSALYAPTAPGSQTRIAAEQASNWVGIRDIPVETPQGKDAMDRFYQKHGASGTVSVAMEQEAKRISEITRKKEARETLLDSFGTIASTTPARAEEIIGEYQDEIDALEEVEKKRVQAKSLKERQALNKKSSKIEEDLASRVKETSDRIIEASEVSDELGKNLSKSDKALLTDGIIDEHLGLDVTPESRNVIDKVEESISKKTGKKVSVVTFSKKDAQEAFVSPPVKTLERTNTSVPINDKAAPVSPYASSGESIAVSDKTGKIGTTSIADQKVAVTPETVLISKEEAATPKEDTSLLRPSEPSDLLKSFIDHDVSTIKKEAERIRYARSKGKEKGTTGKAGILNEIISKVQDEADIKGLRDQLDYAVDVVKPKVTYKTDSKKKTIAKLKKGEKVTTKAKAKVDTLKKSANDKLLIKEAEADLKRAQKPQVTDKFVLDEDTGIYSGEVEGKQYNLVRDIDGILIDMKTGEGTKDTIAKAVNGIKKKLIDSNESFLARNLQSSNKSAPDDNNESTFEEDYGDRVNLEKHFKTITDDNVFTKLREVAKGSYGLNTMIDFLEKASKVAGYTEWDITFHDTTRDGVGGNYEESDGSIQILLPDAMGSFYSKKQYMSEVVTTMLHEMNHAITAHGINTNHKVAAELEELMVEVAEQLPENLRNLWDGYYVPEEYTTNVGPTRLNKDFESLVNGGEYTSEDIGVVYGLLTVHEMSSSVYDSKDLVRILKNTKVKDTTGYFKNALEKFLHIVSKFFGKSTDGVTAYEALMAKTLEIADLQNRLGTKEEAIDAYYRSVVDNPQDSQMTTGDYEDLTLLLGKDIDPEVLYDDSDLNDLDDLYGTRYKVGSKGDVRLNTKVVIDKKSGKMYKITRADNKSRWGNKKEITERELDVIKKNRLAAKSSLANKFANKESENIKKTVSQLAKTARTVADEYIESVAEVVSKVSPKIGGMLRTMESRIATKDAEYNKEILPLFQKYHGVGKLKKTGGLSKTDKATFDFYWANYEDAEYSQLLDEFVEAKGMKQEFDKAKGVLEDIHRRYDEVGLNPFGQKSSYLPRRVKDTKGLFAYLDKHPEDTGPLAEILKDPRLTPKEKEIAIKALADTVSNGRIPSSALKLPSSVKERTIKMVNSEMMEFYENPMDTLAAHISEANEAIETRSFTGKTKRVKIAAEIRQVYNDINRAREVKDTKREEKLQAKMDRLFQDYDGFDDPTEAFSVSDIKESLAEVLYSEGNTYSEEDQERLLHAIRSRLTQKGMHGGIAKVRDVGLMTALGDVISTITQLADPALSAGQFGIGNTISALFSQKFITASDMNMQGALSEYQRGGFAKSIDSLLTLTGFKGLDGYFKGVSMSAALKQGSNMSQAKFVEEWTDIFGAEESRRLHKEIQQLLNGTGELTQNVRDYVFFQVSKINPISLSEMPARYLTAGNGRIFYTLKSYNIKAFSMLRREALSKMTKKETFVSGVGNLVKLSTILVAANMGTDELKDWILGRDQDISDQVQENLMNLFLLSDYTLERGKQIGFGKAMVIDTLIPPGLSAFDPLFKDTLNLLEADKDKRTYGTLKKVPVLGRWMYSRTTEGEQKILDREKKNLYARIREDIRSGSHDYTSIRKDINRYNRKARVQGLKPISNKQIRKVKSSERKKIRKEKLQ